VEGVALGLGLGAADAGAALGDATGALGATDEGAALGDATGAALEGAATAARGGSCSGRISIRGPSRVAA
jgi:hypothetical protein